MAKMKPYVAAAISGCIGGVEFAMSRAGIVVKRRRPSKPFDSTAQITANAAFLRRVADWHEMTPEAMREWTAYAASHPVLNRLGQQKYISGYNWFMKLRDTEDGILLPIETAPPPIFGEPEVYEGGPYTFPITWPAASDDDWMITVYFGELIWESGEHWPLLYKNGGTYRKGDIDDLNFATLSAKGIVFTVGNWYLVRGVITAARYFPSAFGWKPFYCVPEIQWAFHYTMDDNAATPTVVDAYGHFNQTFEGTDPNTEDHHVAGVHDGALHFNGSDNYIELSEESYKDFLDDGQPFTIALWWKPDAPMGAVHKYFFSNWLILAPYVSFSIREDQSVVALGFQLGGAKWGTSCIMAEADTSDWRHFAVVRDGTNVKVYRNGVERLNATNATAAGHLWSATDPLSIGARRSVSDFAAGAADDVYLFNRALSPEEIAALATP